MRDIWAESVLTVMDATKELSPDEILRLGYVTSFVNLHYTTRP